MLIRVSLFIWFASTVFVLVSAIYLVKHVHPPAPRPVIIILPAPPTPRWEAPESNKMISVSGEEKMVLRINRWI